MSRPSPHGTQFSLLVESPDIFDAVRDLVSEDFPCCPSHVLIPSRKDNLISFKFRPVCKDKAVGLDLADLLTLLDLDLAIDDELAGSYVDVVATTTLEVLHEKSRVIWTIVNLEPRFFEAC